VTQGNAIALVHEAAFQDAFRKYAQGAPSAADVLMAQSGVDPAMVQGYGGLAAMLAGATKFPRYSYASPTSIWKMMEARGRRY